MDLFKEINTVKDARVRGILFQLMQRMETIERAISLAFAGEDPRPLLEWKGENKD